MAARKVGCFVGGLFSCCSMAKEDSVPPYEYRLLDGSAGMIVGIGVDCVKVARMEKSMQRPAFMEKVFSAEERAFLESLYGKKRMESAAACFAAKEAFLKALQQGLGGFPLKEIAALRRESGAPYYQLAGAAAAYVQEKGLAVHLSLTHEEGLAIAFALVETAE